MSNKKIQEMDRYTGPKTQIANIIDITINYYKPIIIDLFNEGILNNERQLLPSGYIKSNNADQMGHLFFSNSLTL